MDPNMDPSTREVYGTKFSTALDKLYRRNSRFHGRYLVVITDLSCYWVLVEVDVLAVQAVSPLLPPE